MITVYGYGWEVPKPPEPPRTPWGTYLVLAGGLWWAWKKGWLNKLKGGSPQ